MCACRGAWHGNQWGQSCWGIDKNNPCPGACTWWHTTDQSASKPSSTSSSSPSYSSPSFNPKAAAVGIIGALIWHGLEQALSGPSDAELRQKALDEQRQRELEEQEQRQREIRERQAAMRERERIERERLERENKALAADNLTKQGIEDYQDGRLDSALAKFEEAKKYAKELGLTEMEAGANRNIALTLERMGRSRDAIRYYEASIKLYELTGNYKMVVANRFSMGDLYHKHDSSSYALKQYEDALETLNSRLGDNRQTRLMKALADERIGTVYHEQDMKIEAITSYRSAIDLYSINNQSDKVSLLSQRLTTLTNELDEKTKGGMAKELFMRRVSRVKDEEGYITDVTSAVVGNQTVELPTFKYDPSLKPSKELSSILAKPTSSRTRKESEALSRLEDLQMEFELEKRKIHDKYAEKRETNIEEFYCRSNPNCSLPPPGANSKTLHKDPHMKVAVNYGAAAQLVYSIESGSRVEKARNNFIDQEGLLSGQEASEIKKIEERYRARIDKLAKKLER